MSISAFYFCGEVKLLTGHIVDTWDIPGGRTIADESIHEALTRELREEIG